MPIMHDGLSWAGRMNFALKTVCEYYIFEATQSDERKHMGPKMHKLLTKLLKPKTKRTTLVKHLQNEQREHMGCRGCSSQGFGDPTVN